MMSIQTEYVLPMLFAEQNPGLRMGESDFL